MSKTLLITLIGLGIVIVAVIVISVLIINMKKSKAALKEDSSKKREDLEPEITFDDLLRIVKSKQSTKNDLTKAIIKAARDFPFPQKKGNSLSNEAKKYLNFVFLTAAHPNADAKMIAFMDKELKRVNPSYKMEIDVYEDRGVNGRSRKLAV